MATFIIAQLTIRESQRRRILWVALLMGLGFLAIFGLGFHYVWAEVTAQVDRSEVETVSGVLLTAGLYATNFLITIMAVLISVTTISGEIDSHTIETLLTKPIRRWEVVLGKWLGFAFMILLYIIMLAGGIMLFVYWRAGFLFQNIPAGIGLMILQSLIVLSVTIAGGTRLSTLANGALAFMLYGITFLGGWIEQVGALLRNETAVNIGIFTSLVMPSEILWKKALTLFQPRFATTSFLAGPFTVSSQPSDLMIIYAFFYAAGLLGLALWSFSVRDL
jgi:ABC-type transport system involved in multi-copper enzyme maturation permease subunit